MSDTVEWAVHCCTVLGALPDDQALPAARLAEFHDVPPAYLAKALQALTAAGITESARAARRLPTGPPAEITLLEVVLAVDGAATAFRCREIRRGPALGLAGLPPALRHRPRCGGPRTHGGPSWPPRRSAT